MKFPRKFKEISYFESIVLTASTRTPFFPNLFTGTRICCSISSCNSPGDAKNRSIFNQSFESTRNFESNDIHFS